MIKRMFLLGSILGRNYRRKILYLKSSYYSTLESTSDKNKRLLIKLSKKKLVRQTV